MYKIEVISDERKKTEECGHQLITDSVEEI